MAETKKYTKTVLSKLTVKELASTLEDEGLEADDDWLKANYIEALLEVDLNDDEEDDDDELDDVDVDEVDDEVDDEEEDDEIEADEVDDEPAAAPAKKTRAAAKPKAEAAEGSTVAAKQVATILGTEAKTLRQFFRSTASTIEPVGSGGRYEFDEADVPKIKAEFDAWKAGHASRGSKRTGEGSTRTRSRGPKVAEITEVDEVEELEIEELEDEELDDADLSLDEADDEEDD